MRAFLRDFPVLIFSAIFAIFSFIVPKKKDLWLFWPGHEKNRFSGNLKYLFLYIIETKKTISPIWVTKKRDVFSEITSLSFPVKKYSILPFWQLLRADKILIDTLETDISLGRFNFFQLWHGTGFKNIAALSSKGKVRFRIRKHLSLYNLVVATSREDQQRKQEAFLTNNVFITGSPRNDIFYCSGLGKARLKEQIGIGNFNRIVLYAPTFRDNGILDPFNYWFWEEINTWARSTDILFAIRKHPGERSLNVPEGFSNIKDLSKSTLETQELLSISDILISDYSGIVTDFSLTGRPIIFYIFDFETYQKISRSFYYDIEAILPGPFAKDQRELLDLIKNVNWHYDPQYQEHYKQFVGLFHKFQDGNSSERLFNIIRRI